MTLTRRVPRGITTTLVATAAVIVAVTGCSSSSPAAAPLNSTITSTPPAGPTIESPAPAQLCSGTMASPAGGLIVCPATAAVGGTVTITADAGCGAGAPSPPIVMFLGPVGGAQVATTPTGTGFSASYRIPASYPGSAQSGTSGLDLPVAPGSQYQFSTAAAGACSVPFTVARAPSGMAGAFADTWHFHVTSLSIGSDGDGVATWQDPSLCGSTPGCHGDTAATFVLSDVTGTTAQALIEASNDPQQMPVGTSLTLTLEPHDTLSVSGVSGGSPYYGTALCGSEAASLSVAQQQAAGIGCGA
jgi:hypothetical protein